MSVDALRPMEGMGMFGRAGRAGEVSECASEAIEAACEKAECGMLSGCSVWDKWDASTVTSD